MGIANRVRIKEIQTLSDDWYVLKKTIFDFQRRDGSWQRQSRETYDRGDGATILLLDASRRTVLLVRQFRLPAFVNGYDDLLIEAPAGLLEETAPEERIRLEAEEEAGVAVHAVRPLFQAYMSPGSVTEKLHFFIGEYRPEDRRGGGGGIMEEGEDIEVIELSLDDALAMIDSGAICDAKTIMLLLYADRLLSKPHRIGVEVARSCTISAPASALEDTKCI